MSHACDVVSSCRMVGDVASYCCMVCKVTSTADVRDT